MLLGSGLLNRSDLWPLAATHAAFRHRCSVQGRKVSWPRWSAIINMKTSFFEGDENNDFDVNTAPMTFRPIVKDAGATIVRVKDVEKSPGTPREQWRSAIQSQTRALCEHDVYPAVGFSEVGGDDSRQAIPGRSGGSVRTISVRLFNPGWD